MRIADLGLCVEPVSDRFTAEYHAIKSSSPTRRGAGVAERGCLLSSCTGLNLYRGFESLPLRHTVFNNFPN